MRNEEIEGLKIVHIIPSLNSGGAEAMLYKLLKNQASPNNSIEIVTLLSAGFYADQIRKMKYPVHELNLKTARNPFKVFLQLVKVFRKADIIQSWMYHSDLIAFVLGKLMLRKKVIWGIRRSYLDKEYMRVGTYYTAKICAYLSKYVDGIISCTFVGKKNHEKFGYKNHNFIVISNGFDLEEFDECSNMKKTNKLLRLLNVARWEPLKDHRTLFAAAHDLKEKGFQYELLLVGSGMDKNNESLLEMICEYNIGNEVKLLGVRKDIPDLMRSSDIYISSSLSEGFPNVIGEAMASGLFCVATNAGDTKYIIDGFGAVVSIKDPIKLAEGIIRAIRMDKNDLRDIKHQARKRIEEEFSIQHIAKQYETMYQKIGNK